MRSILSLIKSTDAAWTVIQTKRDFNFVWFLSLVSWSCRYRSVLDISLSEYKEFVSLTLPYLPNFASYHLICRVDKAFMSFLGQSWFKLMELIISIPTTVNWILFRPSNILQCPNAISVISVEAKKAFSAAGLCHEAIWRLSDRAIDVQGFVRRFFLNNN